MKEHPRTIELSEHGVPAVQPITRADSGVLVTTSEVTELIVAAVAAVPDTAKALDTPCDEVSAESLHTSVTPNMYVLPVLTASDTVQLVVALLVCTLATVQAVSVAGVPDVPTTYVMSQLENTEDCTPLDNVLQP